MSVFRKLLLLLGPALRRRLLIVFLLMLLGMGFEMVSIGLVLPVIGLISSPKVFEQFPVVTSFVASFGSLSQDQLLVWGVIILGVIYAVKNIYLVVLAWIQSSFVFSMNADLSQRLFSKYIHDSYIVHLKRNSSHLIRNIVVEVNQLTNAMQAFTMLAAEMLVLAGVSLLLLYVEPGATLIVVSVFGSAAVAFYLVIRRKLNVWGADRQQNEEKRIRTIQEGLGSIKEIKLYGHEGKFLELFDGVNAKNARIYRNQLFLQQVPRLWLELLAVTGLGAVVLVLIAQGRSAAEFLPTIGLFGAAAFRLMPSINRCLTSVQSTRFAVPAINTLYCELADMQDLTDGKLESSRDFQFTGQIELTNVSFRYPDADRLALQSVNLVIPRGSSVGFVGESGAGKSTLVDIILGLITPTEGAVLVDGSDIRQALRGWQDQIGYVPQSIFLTDDSLRRNIAFGLPDSEIDDEAVWRALLAARLDAFVKSLPMGLETTVGERGVRISGGQCQRIGIARALYHNPSVLVLDEATSSLDVETENGVMEAVRAMHGEKTIIIITHRLSTVKQCDRLVRLATGRILEGDAYVNSLVEGEEVMSTMRGH